METPLPARNDAPAPNDAPIESTPPRRDTLLVFAFWTWAAVLLLATLAQLFGWDGVLDVLDVKRWFAR